MSRLKPRPTNLQTCHAELQNDIETRARVEMTEGAVSHMQAGAYNFGTLAGDIL